MAKNKHKFPTTKIVERKDSVKEPTPPAPHHGTDAPGAPTVPVQGDTDTMPLADVPEDPAPAEAIDQRRPALDLNEKLYKMFASIEFSTQLDGSRRILLRGGRRYNGVRRTFQTVQEMFDYVSGLDLA